MKRYRVRCAFGVLGILTLLAVGCSGAKNDDKKAQDGKADAKKSEDKTSDGGVVKDNGGGSGKDTKPDVTTTAKELAADFKKDPNTMAQKYKGLIELSGTVQTIARVHSDGNYSIVLEGGEDSGVECYVKDEKPWKSALPGQKVKIRGKWAGYTFVERLHECKIVESTGMGPPTLKAAELSKAWASDKEGTDNKYKKKKLILEGEITTAERKESSFDTKFTFKTPEGGARIAVWTGNSEGHHLKDLKAGAQVKMLAEYPSMVQEDILTFVDGILID